MKKNSFRDDILPMKDKLYRLALRITSDAVEAEDIVQDTMMKVWMKRDEWAQMDSLEAYCLTVCRNLSLDRSERKGNRLVELDESQHGGTDANGPHDTLTAREGAEFLEKFLQDLPEVQQEIFHLREVEGKSYKEIAKVLKLSEEQVKVYLFRARQRVRQKYTETYGYGL